MVIRANESAVFEAILKVYHVAVLIYDSTGAVLDRFSPNPESDEFLLIVSNCKEQLFQLCNQSRQPQVITNEINQMWAGVPLFEGENLTRLIVLGPVHTSDFSKKQAANYIRSYHFSAQYKEDVLAALEQAPVCPYPQKTTSSENRPSPASNSPVEWTLCLTTGEGGVWAGMLSGESSQYCWS